MELSEGVGRPLRGRFVLTLHIAVLAGNTMTELDYGTRGFEHVYLGLTTRKLEKHKGVVRWLGRTPGTTVVLGKGHI